MGKSKKHSTELVYVFKGDPSLASIECEKLIDSLLTPDDKPTGLIKPDAKSVKISDVLDELRTLPFLAARRVVVIKDADKFITENRAVLEKYFDKPSPTGILVLMVNSWSASTKLAKKLSGIGKLIAVKQPKGRELTMRLCEYARQAHDKELSQRNAGFLIELAGDNVGRLYSEIDKLAVFADTDRGITEKHITDLIGHNRLFNAFNVIDAVVAGNTAGALSRLREMFASDKSTEYTVVGAFAFQFRKMFNAKALLDRGVNRQQTMRTVGIWGNVQGFFDQLNRMSLVQIGDGLKELATIDYSIKTGRAKPKVAMEQLVLKMSSGMS